MKRLVKKSDTWWDSDLPGVMSDRGYFLQLDDNEAKLYKNNGEFIREFNLKNLHLTDSIREILINILNSYLSELDIEDSLK